MIIPVRCTSCGKPIGHLWEKYKEEIEKGKKPKEIMDKLGLERYCCRGVFMGHIDLLDIISRYQKS